MHGTAPWTRQPMWRLAGDTIDEEQMATLASNLAPASPAYTRNKAHMLDLIKQGRPLEQRAGLRSARSAANFHERGKLLPRERLAHLPDPGRPFLELMTLAGYCGIEDRGPATSIPGSALIVGIGHISGVRCMVAVNDAGISAGAMQSLTGQKLIRAQEIALAHKLPFVQLVESAGGNLKKYRVERFIV